MPELSNLIRQRLGATKAPATHPDADLISAYAEGGLRQSERAELTRHLAVCADCRELLALSLPEQAAATAPVSVLKPQSRFSASSLRIAASLAMVLVVVMLLLKRHQEPATRTETASSPQGEVARSTPSSVQPAANEVRPSTAEITSKLTASTEQRAVIARARQLARVREKRAPQAAAMTEIPTSAPTVEIAKAALPQDYINSQVLANQLLLADQARRPVQALPSAPETKFDRDQKKVFLTGVVTRADFSEIPFDSIQQKTQTTSTVSIFRDQSHHGLSITSTIARVGTELVLKRPMAQITSQNASRYALFKPGLGGSAGAELASSPTENSENLKQSPAFTGLALAAPSRPQSQLFLWRIIQGKLLKSSDMSNWMEGYPATEGIDFTVVRSAGPDVWAGGSNAALIHSTDSGASWQRIVLGAAATGAITGIEVSGNGKNIQVTSSSGQSWASPDGGRTWMMMN
jgi:hypothetical protein